MSFSGLSLQSTSQYVSDCDYARPERLQAAYVFSCEVRAAAGDRLVASVSVTLSPPAKGASSAPANPSAPYSLGFSAFARSAPASRG